MRARVNDDNAAIPVVNEIGIIVDHADDKVFHRRASARDEGNLA
jgi:hypothetical protein